MIETRRLKNVVIFIQTILSFVLSRKIYSFYLSYKRPTLTVAQFFKQVPIHFLTTLQVVYKQCDCSD